MFTATLQSTVQRHRFAQHAYAVLVSLIPGFRRVGAPKTASEFAAAEAQKVRQLAYAYSKTDPGFAADLYAAAARHEGSGTE